VTDDSIHLDGRPAVQPPDVTAGSPTDEITAESAAEALYGHLVDKAMAARIKYGLHIDTEAVLQMLDDREVVRYPTTLSLEAGPLQPHEFAFPQPLGFHPSDGYALCLHPAFTHHREIWPLLVAYHIPVINYGPVVDERAAELYGSTLLGLEVDTYYQALCELTDSIPRDAGHAR
jgi:hypothetical protein